MESAGNPQGKLQCGSLVFEENLLWALGETTLHGQNKWAYLANPPSRKRVSSILIPNSENAT